MPFEAIGGTAKLATQALDCWAELWGLGIRAETVAEGRRGADDEVIFRLECALAQGAAVIGGDVERHHRQPAPGIQEQLQDETYLAAWTSPAAVSEHASSPYGDSLALTYRSQKTDHLLCESELLAQELENCAGPTCMMRRAAGSLAGFFQPSGAAGRALPCLSM